MRNTLQKVQKGFTIIEVMIVLAIAGLIIAVVIVAVPQLQRNQRNSARQADVSRVGVSVQNWVSNNGGKVFDGLATSQTTVRTDVGATMNQYSLSTTTLTSEACGVTTAGDACSATVAKTGVTNVDNMNVVTGAVCDTDGKAKAGTSRQFVMQFAAETSSTTPAGRCLAY
jgi:prepilin-type N-terminal cleavage/methylation domain-containing protein